MTKIAAAAVAAVAGIASAQPALVPVTLSPTTGAAGGDSFTVSVDLASVLGGTGFDLEVFAIVISLETTNVDISNIQLAGDLAAAQAVNPITGAVTNEFLNSSDDVADLLATNTSAGLTLGLDGDDAQFDLFTFDASLVDAFSEGSITLGNGIASGGVTVGYAAIDFFGTPDFIGFGLGANLTSEAPTSTIPAIPAPGAVAVAGLGGLVAARRRR